MSASRVVMGITAFNHDSSACIITDGRVVAFAEEERFTGVKHTSAFPGRAIKYCLEEAGLSERDVTDVAFYFDLKECWKSYFRNNHPVKYLRDPSTWRRRRYFYQLAWLSNFTVNVWSIRRRLSGTKLRIHYVPHHLAHAWYGYFASGLTDCIVLSNDSVGEQTATLAIQFSERDGKITTQTLFEQSDPHSLGYLYGAVTEHLGFTRGEGEGRVMALASFAKRPLAKPFDDGIKLLPHGQFRIRRSLLLGRSFQPRGERLSRAAVEAFGPARQRDGELASRHYNLAAGVQHALKRVGFHQLDYLTQLADNVVLVGGVAQNSVFNGQATERYPTKLILVPPIPHDAGASLGAAVHVWYQIAGHLPERTETAFLGPKYSTQSVEERLANNQLHSHKLSDSVGFMVDELAAGRTVAVFRGRMEGGPRALCNRSIIANPATASMRDHLNHHVKYREDFRPYGGFMLASRLPEVLVHSNRHRQGPYMSYVYLVKPEWRDKIPSLVHVDQTCRIQIVPDDAGWLADLLRAFESRTGVPVLINTSMNLRGYPIARTPEDALATFYTSAIDHLVFNDELVVSK